MQGDSSMDGFINGLEYGVQTKERGKWNEYKKDFYKGMKLNELNFD